MNSFQWTTDTTSTNTILTSESLLFAIRVLDPPLPEGFVTAVYEACSWLDLEPPLANLDVVKAARKRLAKVHHPDVGGDEASMQQINAAADFLLGLR